MKLVLQAVFDYNQTLENIATGVRDSAYEMPVEMDMGEFNKNWFIFDT